MRRDLEDGNLIGGGKRHDDPPSVKVDRAEMGPRRLAAQRVVRCSATLSCKTLDDPDECWPVLRRHLLRVLAGACDIADRELGRWLLQPLPLRWQASGEEVFRDAVGIDHLPRLELVDTVAEFGAGPSVLQFVEDPAQQPLVSADSPNLRGGREGLTE